MNGRPMTRNTFLHYRLFNKEGVLQPRGGMTLAYICIGAEDEKRLFAIGSSRCSTSENFCRREGRTYAIKYAFGGIGGVLEDEDLAPATFEEIKEIGDVIAINLFKRLKKKGYKLVLTRRNRNRMPKIIDIVG